MAILVMSETRSPRSNFWNNQYRSLNRFHLDESVSTAGRI